MSGTSPTLTGTSQTGTFAAVVLEPSRDRAPAEGERTPRVPPRALMLRLETFGGVVLRENGVPHAGEASQRRRLGLLAVLAASGRPVSRERLLSFFWPEIDEERGRHALRQSTYALQRALRAENLFLGTTALQLNPEIVRSDVAEFDDAVARGDTVRAASLYAGPFLDGFYLEGLTEFERWVEGERSRLGRAFASALESLAAMAAARRDHHAAVGWWRRLAAEDPLSSRYTIGLMQALTAVGDRAAALRLAGVHAALVKQELQSLPDPAVIALEAQLRSGATLGPSAAAPSRASAAGTATAESPGDARVTGEHRDPLEEAYRGRVERALGARFLVEEPLAVGGSLTSYAAFDRSRGIKVELNIVSPRIASPGGEAALGEALERIQGLDHPGITRMYEFGWAEDLLFYVLARDTGPSLREYLERERQLPVAEAVSIADSLAAALAYAHERGVLHGDLRSKHVQVVGPSRGVVKSFGIMNALVGSGAGGSSTVVRFGSPAYLSPEQLAGERMVTERTDQYGLGCLLYEMLTGEVPFASASQMKLVTAKLTQDAPYVRAMRQSVPDDLDGIVRRCLGRLPADRFRSIAEVREALSRVRLVV